MRQDKDILVSSQQINSYFCKLVINKWGVSNIKLKECIKKQGFMLNRYHIGKRLISFWKCMGKDKDIIVSNQQIKSCYCRLYNKLGVFAVGEQMKDK